MSVRDLVGPHAPSSFTAFVVPTHMSSVSSATVSVVPSGAKYESDPPELLTTQVTVCLPVKYVPAPLGPMLEAAKFLIANPVELDEEVAN